MCIACTRRALVIDSCYGALEIVIVIIIIIIYGLKTILHDKLHWLDVPDGLSTSSVWWCTGVFTDRHLATLPLMLLRDVVIYDLPTWTVSLCPAVGSALTAVGHSTMLVRQSGTRCQMNLEIRTVSIVLNGSWKQLSSAATNVTGTLEVIYISRSAI